MNIQPSAMALETLRNASASLRVGQHARAQQLLGELLKIAPDLVEAHWLLANSFLEVRNFEGAQRELQTCISLAPHKGEAHITLGRLLASNGQSMEAEHVLRGALRLEGSGLPATYALARLFLLQHRAEESRSLIEAAICKGAATAELLTLYAHALMSLGEKSAAAAAFAQILDAQPDNLEARFQLAAVLADNEQPIEAEVQVRKGIAAGGKTPDAGFVLARALMGQDRFSEAEAELTQVVRARPEHVLAQGNLSELVWMRTGNIDEASTELDAALEADPRISALRIAKVRLLLAAHLPERALQLVEAGLMLSRSDLILLNAAANIALNCDGERALNYARRALHIVPEEHSVLVAFGNASLAVGRPQDALDTSEKLLLRNPHDGHARTMQIDAWRMLGDVRYRTLADYARFVRTELIDTPRGWLNLPAYLADLVQEIECLHKLHAHPLGQSLREGSQVQLSLEHSRGKAVRAFPQAIDGPIRRYMDALGTGDDALSHRNTGRYQLNGSWSVRLRPHGFHVNHHHPKGWLSSAFYLQLPSSMGSGGGEGWLQFGEPGFPTSSRLGPEYFLRPVAGLLALFPSYMWHGTVPFTDDSGGRRLTIAFDVLPA